MPALSRADLWSLEEYSELRPGFRQQVMAHKKNRQVALGEYVRLYFEDAITIKYQIQEMLRIEKVFEAVGIEDKVWVQVEDCDRVHPIADEDISRQNEVKTSSVHFLRFELTPVMMAALARGAAIFAGIEHPAYTVASIRLPAGIRDSLAGDIRPASVN